MKVITRYHDFSYGHRVYGHESKCSHLHGHNGRVTFYVTGELDPIGRIIDFGKIGKLLCEWLEINWDHRFLLWDRDPMCINLTALDRTVVTVPFNPTAENMAQYLLDVVGPDMLKDTTAKLISVKFEETRKCAAVATGGNDGE